MFPAGKQRSFTLEDDNKFTKGMKTKQIIYDSAKKLFEKYEIDKVSVDDIVKKAGVSKGTFYIHFTSKWSIIEEYIETLDSRYAEYYDSIPKDTPSAETIALVTRNTAHVLSHNIGYNILRHGYAAMLLGKLDSDEVLNLGRSLPGIYRKIFIKGINNGEFKSSADAGELSNLVISIIRGTAFEWCSGGCAFDLENKTIKYIKLLLASYKK